MRSAPITPPPLAEALGLLERAVGYTRGALSAVTPAVLHRPTPCPDWDLAALLDHMADSLGALTEAADLGFVDLRTPSGPPSPVQAVEDLRVRACSLLGAWSALARDRTVLVGDLQLASSLLAVAGALEVAVHGWDVSAATSLAGLPLPADLAADLLGWADVLVDPADRPHRFGPPVAVPAGASPSAVLLGRLGRRALPAVLSA